jgi:NAD(P)-dependent dehydrogenase (short-subunit alcohol dehydrogenase family)
MSNVLVTGCSSGIGFSLAQALCDRGHHVIATMRALAGRNADSAARLRAACEGSSGQLHVLELDVTDDASVAGAIEQAIARTHTIDAVVHNAGLGSLGLIESFTVEQVRAMFEVNVFGTQRVNRAVLPHMRAQGNGLVLYVSSAIGRILFPYFGAYGPTKFALEAMAECYHNELRPLGIDVTIVQAGGYATAFFPNALQPGDRECIAAYGEHGERAMKFWMSGDMPPLPPPTELASSIADIIELPVGTRPLRKVIDPMFGQAMEAINHTTAEIQGQVLRGLGVG